MGEVGEVGEVEDGDRSGIHQGTQISMEASESIFIQVGLWGYPGHAGRVAPYRAARDGASASEHGSVGLGTIA